MTAPASTEPSAGAPGQESIRTQIKLVEYQAAQATYLHYDAFRWQAGSFLIAGVFIFWGLLVQRSTQLSLVAGGSALVTGLMSTWLLFAHHYRQIYLAKLNRIHQIEADLGMEQHRRFTAHDGAPPRYRIFGPNGHDLDIVVYLLTVLGIPLLASARNGFSWWYLISLPAAIAVVATVIVNERRIQRLLDSPDP